MVESTSTRIKASEYYQLPEYERHDLIQLINGEVVIGMPPILKHQLLIKKLLLLLAQVEAQQGGVAFTAPTEVRFDEHNIFEPDLIYISPENISIAQQDEKRIMGAPDLVAEVLSPSTAKFDRQDKYQAYERHGVGEYWIVDPVHETIEVWTLDENTQFSRQGAYGKTGTSQSVTLQTIVEVKAIFDV